MLELNGYFYKYVSQPFKDTEEGYLVENEKAHAYITVYNNEIICPIIHCFERNYGTQLIDSIEKLAIDNKIKIKFLNVPDNYLIERLLNRGYKKDYAPYLPNYGLNNLVDVYILGE